MRGPGVHAYCIISTLDEIFSKCIYVHCMYFVLPPWLSWDILCLSDFIKDSLLWWTDILHISLKREGIGMAWSLFFSSLLPNDFDLYYVQGVSHWNEQSKLALTDGQIEIFNFISRMAYSAGYDIWFLSNSFF